MMPIEVGTLTGSVIGGASSQRFGGKWLFVCGMAVLACGPALLATYRPDPYVTGVWLFLTGGGFGSAVGAEGTFVVQAAPEDATATAINTLARLLGGGIGTQIGTIILLAGRFPRLQLSHFWSYRDAFLIAAGVAAGGAAVGTLVRTQGPEPAAAG